MECQKLCLQKYFVDRCNCQDYTNHIFDDKPKNKCDLEDQNKCAKELYFEFIGDSKLLNDCDCPMKCEYSGFAFTSSWAQYPTAKYYKYLLNMTLIKEKYANWSYEDVAKSVARVQVGFEEMKHTYVTEEIKTHPLDVFASVGGHLGLFLGASLLSLVEFVEIFIQSIFVLAHKYATNFVKFRMETRFL